MFSHLHPCCNILWVYIIHLWTNPKISNDEIWLNLYIQRFAYDIPTMVGFIPSYFRASATPSSLFPDLRPYINRSCLFVLKHLGLPALELFQGLNTCSFVFPQMFVCSQHTPLCNWLEAEDPPCSSNLVYRFPLDNLGIPNGSNSFDTPWYPSTIWCDVPSPQGLVNGSNASWTIPVLYHPLRIFMDDKWCSVTFYVFFANLPILANPKPHKTLEFVGKCTVEPSFTIRENQGFPVFFDANWL